MQLEVLIVTPSGPFGELIRLTLEADPEFRCSMLDNSGELRVTLQEKPCQAVIYDCSFPQPMPGQVVTSVHEEFPGTAILLIPADNRSESSIPADGWVTRPFDASSLMDAVKTAILKNKNPEAVKFIPKGKEPEHKPASWWNAFQSGVRDTAAESGLMVQNGLVIASTPNISTALQQQVTASVLRFWNPDESSDLMRYVKDLVNGQEWMMYATKAAEGAVLVLLYLPQTPVTRVRAQTLKLAKDVAGLMGKPAQDTHRTGIPENAEPLRLHEILGEKGAGGSGHVIKNGFPVEWFREADLPDFQETSSADEPSGSPLEETPELSPAGQPVDAEQSVDESAVTEAPLEETPPAETAAGIPMDDSPAPGFELMETTSFEESTPDGLTASVPMEDFPVTEYEQTVSPTVEEPPTKNQPEPDSNTAPTAEEPDLGMFQAVSLIPEDKEDSGLDEMQPITLESVKPETSITEQIESKTEVPAELEPAIDGIESAGPLLEPTAPVFDLSERPVVSRDEVEEALSVLSNRLNMENTSIDEVAEGDVDIITPDAQKILSETDSNGIDVASFQAELSKLEFNDTWAMPQIMTGSPQEPSNISQSESDEMATFLAGIEAQTPQLIPVETSILEPELELSSINETSEPVAAVEALSTTAPVENFAPVIPEEQEFTPEAVSPGVVPIEPAALIDTAEPVTSTDSVQSTIAQPVELDSSDGDLFARMNKLETPADSGAMETYTVALIPGAENLYIQRQNSAILSQTMNRLALAFHWTLENLTIRPTYIQWTLSMSATLPPEDMISIIRKETTADLKKANPEDLSSIGDDYWFPQTMSAAGRDFVPSIHWQDFILRRKTREIA
jgi:hypothetical protein